MDSGIAICNGKKATVAVCVKHGRGAVAENDTRSYLLSKLQEK